MIIIRAKIGLQQSYVTDDGDIIGVADKELSINLQFEKSFLLHFCQFFYES